MRFEELAGIVEVLIVRDGDRVASTMIAAPGHLSIDPIPTEIELAPCAGLDPADIESANHAPVMAGVGLPFAVAELTDLDALARARPVAEAFRTASEVLPGLPGGLALFMYVRISEEPLTIQARMFAPLDNVPEDPATGSAAAACGALLAHLRPEPDLQFPVIVRQGFEMGRPSLISLNVAKVDGLVRRVDVSGESVAVMSGTLTL